MTSIELKTVPSTSDPKPSDPPKTSDPKSSDPPKTTDPKNPNPSDHKPDMIAPLNDPKGDGNKPPSKDPTFSMTPKDPPPQFSPYDFKVGVENLQRVFPTGTYFAYTVILNIVLGDASKTCDNEQVRWIVIVVIAFSAFMSFGLTFVQRAAHNGQPGEDSQVVLVGCCTWGVWIEATISFISFLTLALLSNEVVECLYSQIDDVWVQVVPVIGSVLLPTLFSLVRSSFLRKANCCCYRPEFF